MHTMTAPTYRTGTPTEVAATNHAIVDSIREVEYIGEITVVIVEITPVTGLAVATLPLVVGLDLMTQKRPLNQPIFAETNPIKITWNISTGKTGAPQIHARAGMRSRRTQMNKNVVA